MEKKIAIEQEITSKKLTGIGNEKKNHSARTTKSAYVNAAPCDVLMISNSRSSWSADTVMPVCVCVCVCGSIQHELGR